MIEVNESYEKSYAQIQKNFTDALQGGLELLDLARHAVETRNVISESELRKKEQFQDETKKALERAVVNTLVSFMVPPGDVRRIVGIVRSTADLERIGDNAVQIVVAIREANHEHTLLPEIDLAPVFDQVRNLVVSATNALLNEDIQQIDRNRAVEDSIDSSYRQLSRDIVAKMMSDPANIPGGLVLLNVIRRLERIADHAGNIVEHYISIVKEEA